MTSGNWFLKYTQGARKGSEREGILMRLKENEQSRYEFEIWFEYTRQAMTEIQEGTMLAVPNYATTRNEPHYSIIQITSLKPIHYAIGEEPTGFPGFVLEAAKNAAIDWTGQDDEPTEDTTTIRCTAIPTNLELVEDSSGELKFQAEENIPMVGAVTRILDTEPTKQVVNRDINLKTEIVGKDILPGGVLLQNNDVPVYIRVEEFIRVHFGIFGFTGAGKSNLLSTYISQLTKSEQSVKIVFFDLMSEYTPLLIDLINQMDGARVICIGERTLPQPVFNYINDKDKKLKDSTKPAQIFSKFSLLPKALKPYQNQMTLALKKLIESDKLRVYQKVRSMSVYDILWANEQSLANRGNGLRDLSKKGRFKEMVKRLNPTTGDMKQIKVSSDIVEKIKLKIKKEKDDTTQDSKDFGAYLDGFDLFLNEVNKNLDKELNCGIDLTEIIDEINNPDRPSLFVVISNSPDELRKFSGELGNFAFENRRKEGRIAPLASFVFDEADEFIPQNNDGSYAVSRDVAETLARRGRKFGLGIGIATQRTRYLDTSIMAQPHTYLVSKLPQRSDREKVVDAFGISEDMFRQTFKFKPGNWLLMSHDATGLKAVPIPIQTEDANKRLEDYLKTLT